MHPAGALYIFTALHLTYNIPQQLPQQQQHQQLSTLSGGSADVKTTALQLEQNTHKETSLPGSLEDNTLDSYEPIGPDFDTSEYAQIEPTLRQVLILHRHGDRTPYKLPETSPLKNEPFWTFHGLGQLTNRGKRRVYQMGRLVRRRYGQFLNESVNKNLRVSMSSATPRCIESAQLFLSALLPLDLAPKSRDAKALQWDESDSVKLAKIWQPASIQVVPHDIDGMLAGGKCPEFYKDLFREMELTSDFGKKLLRDYNNEIELIKSYYKVTELKSLYDLLEFLDSIQIEGSYFRSKMPPQYDDRFFGRCQEMINQLFGLWQKGTKLRRLGHGLLIDDMLRKMYAFGNEHSGAQQSTANSQSGLSTKPLIHYSAHDSTLTSILGMLGAWNEEDPQQPRFASNIALELHQDSTVSEDNGSEWFVKIFYMQQVEKKDETPIELHVPGCERDHRGSRCTLSRFTQLMRPYRIRSWQDWMSECGNDLEKVDPYTEL